MHPSCISTTVLLLYVLFAQTALIPATISFGNGTLLGLPGANLTGNLPAADVPPIHISSRSIVLAFLRKGEPIPEEEVKATLIDADEAIFGLVLEHPTQRIANDRFEYRRPNGNMLISIKTDTGEVITWMELSRILKSLYRYMTAGMGAEETHYQELEFEVEAGGQEKPNIGLGLVWYLKPTESKVQKRVTLPLPQLDLPQPSDETTRQLPNATLVLPGVRDVQETIIFPIPRTSLSLKIYYLGPSIPVRSIEATLQGAMAKIRPLLNGASENDPIENDAFRWILPLSRAAGVTIPVAVTVFTYHSHIITWRQLFDVLFGLYAFTTTFGTDLVEPHYQILGFRILDNIASSLLGVGSLSYFRSGADQLAKRVNTIDRGSSLRRPRAPNVSLIDLAVSRPIVFPVVDTDITLTFTFLGDTQIPPLAIYGTLIDARAKIAREVAHNPDLCIPESFRYMSPRNHVSTGIHLYPGHVITWTEVDQILKGLLQFCHLDEDHDRVLVFEIDIRAASRGRVGFGTVLFAPAEPINFEKGALAARV